MLTVSHRWCLSRGPSASTLRPWPTVAVKHRFGCQVCSGTAAAVRLRATASMGGPLPWASGEQEGWLRTTWCLKTAFKSQVTSAAQRFGRRTRSGDAARHLAGALFEEVDAGPSPGRCRASPNLPFLSFASCKRKTQRASKMFANNTTFLPALTQFKVAIETRCMTV